VASVLLEAGLTWEAIDTAIIHQPNKALFDAAAQALGLPPEKTIDGFYRYGNTIAAELPIALDESVRNGRIRRGDTVLLVTFGAGFNLGVMVLEF
jgi:3-oxoacyl-[acyl-carrier-protein] synthase-3